MFGSFDISASALGAQRVRLETIASNIANIDTTVGVDGRTVPYRRQYTTFQPQRTADGGAGVRVNAIREDPTPFKKILDKWNPAADPDGYVLYPNVDLFTENVDALETTRAYEANVTAIETTKSMINATLRLLA